MLTLLKGLAMALCCCFLAMPAQSQHITETSWHPGYIILANGNRIEGKVKTDLYRELVQIKTTEGTKAFAPISINSFAFTEVGRVFLSVATHGKALHGIRFYEVKEHTDAGVILQKGCRIINPQSNKSMRLRTPTYRIVYDYYLLEGGVLAPYKREGEV